MEKSVRQRRAKHDMEDDSSDVTKPLLEGAKKLLMVWDELPEWRRDNQFILSGFRPETNSYWECIKSMGYIHNETGNIYSHLLAAFWLTGLGVWWHYYMHDHYDLVTGDDDLVFALFFGGAVICAILSVIYHVLMNHSETTYCWCLKLDFLGILACTAGCFPPALWYIFPCKSREEKLTYITIDLAAQFCAALLALFSKTFQEHKMRPLRAAVFSTMASTQLYPILIKLYQVGWTKADEYGASLYAVAFAIYIFSATIYALRATEAWRPGTFDIWGHSHQLFHIGMVVGLTVHFGAFVKAMHNFYAVKSGRCPD